MSIYKRGKIYWYKFMWNGEMVRESTRQTNQNTARQMEGAHRASLAKGEVGIREKKVAPTLNRYPVPTLSTTSTAMLRMPLRNARTAPTTNGQAG